ncbi:MAG: hypothetical protein H6587_12895 [Flavobacteriales bacterium]|nr:hypothetical protein [Flavobacteriales bacterium]
MKYRVLTKEELLELEEDFKHFLIANGIYDDEWVKINKEDQKKAIELVELFSDVVFDKALKKIKFLEHITPQGINAFFFPDNEVVLIGIISANKEIDFTKDTLNKLKQELNIFRTTKPYFKSREEEIFDLLETGCSIIDEERFKKLELAYTYSTQQLKN